MAIIFRYSVLDGDTQKFVAPSSQVNPREPVEAIHVVSPPRIPEGSGRRIDQTSRLSQTDHLRERCLDSVDVLHRSKAKHHVESVRLQLASFDIPSCIRNCGMDIASSNAVADIQAANGGARLSERLTILTGTAPDHQNGKPRYVRNVLQTLVNELRSIGGHV